MLKNLKIAQRLLLSFGIVLVLLLIVAGLNYWGLGAVATTVSDAFQNEVRLAQDAGKVRTHALAIRQAEKDFLLGIGNRERESENIGKWDEARRQLGGQLQTMLSYVTFRKESDAIKVIKDDLDLYNDTAGKVVAGVREGTLRTAQDANNVLSESKGPLRSLDIGTRLLLEDADKRLEERKESLAAGTKQGGGNVFLLVAFGAIIASAMVFSIYWNFDKQTK